MAQSSFDFSQPSHQQTTKGGYPLDEVVSSLQKEIRRNHTKAAVYWALEMCRSGFTRYLWRRLFIVASEDIGLADDAVASTLQALYANWRALIELTADSKKQESELVNDERFTLPIVHAVMRLATARKNREVADCKTVVNTEYERGTRAEVPDYAKDKHTASGKALGRGEEFFQAEGRYVIPEFSIDGNPFKRELGKLTNTEPVDDIRGTIPGTKFRE